MTIETLEKTKQWAILQKRRGKRRSKSSNEIKNICSRYNCIKISAVLFTKVEILIGSPYKSAHDLLGLSHKCTGTNYWLQHYWGCVSLFKEDIRLWLRYQQCPYCCTTHYKYELSQGGGSRPTYQRATGEGRARTPPRSVTGGLLLRVRMERAEWRGAETGKSTCRIGRAGSLTRQGRAGQSYIKY